jgi:hypothetical protein
MISTINTTNAFSPLRSKETQGDFPPLTWLATLVSSLIGLPSKPPKPTRELSISLFLVIDDNTIKAYIRFEIEDQFLIISYRMLPLNMCFHGNLNFGLKCQIAHA